MSTWPWPGDGAVVIARKVAIMYRTHFHAKDPEACEVLDEAMRAYGQLWAVPNLVTDDDGMSAVTTKEAAAMVGVSEDTIRQWACTQHPTEPGGMLLPRFKKRGRERTYLVEHVREAHRIAVSMKANRRNVS